MSEEDCKKEGKRLHEQYKEELENKKTKNVRLAIVASYNYLLGKEYETAAYRIRDILEEQSVKDIKNSLELLVDLFYHEENRRMAKVARHIIKEDASFQTQIRVVAQAKKQQGGADARCVLGSPKLIAAQLKSEYQKIFDPEAMKPLAEYALLYTDELFEAIERVKKKELIPCEEQGKKLWAEYRKTHEPLTGLRASYWLLMAGAIKEMDSLIKEMVENKHTPKEMQKEISEIGYVLFPSKRVNTIGFKKVMELADAVGDAIESIRLDKTLHSIINSLEMAKEGLKAAEARKGADAQKVVNKAKEFVDKANELAIAYLTKKVGLKKETAEILLRYILYDPAELTSAIKSAPTDYSFGLRK